MAKAVFPVLLATGSLAGLAADAGAVVRARAFAAWVNIPDYGIVDHYVCDTGWLPLTGGGDQTSSETNYSVAGYLEMTQGTARSRSDDDCEGDDDYASVTLGPTTIMQGDPAQLTFTALGGRDDDDCCNPDDDDFTAASFTDLVFAGQPVIVTGLPEQEIIVPGAGRLVLNERRHRNDDDDCDDDDIAINAIHLWPLSGGEIIVGSVTYDDDDDCCTVKARKRTWGTLKGVYR
jgi:hypothetical protein